MASSEQKLKFIMSKPKIVAYLKPTCGWSQGVRAVLRKYDLPYEDRDVINDPLQRQEMIEKSGQMLSPCVEINGQMLPDISGEEVEAWMLANNVVTQNDRTRCADQPALRPRNAAECAAEFRRAPLKNLELSTRLVCFYYKWKTQLTLESELRACTIGNHGFQKIVANGGSRGQITIHCFRPSGHISTSVAVSEGSSECQSRG
jgi:glutaredoxin